MYFSNCGSLKNKSFCSIFREEGREEGSKDDVGRKTEGRGWNWHCCLASKLPLGSVPCHCTHQGWLEPYSSFLLAPGLYWNHRSKKSNIWKQWRMAVVEAMHSTVWWCEISGEHREKPPWECHWLHLHPCNAWVLCALQLCCWSAPLVNRELSFHLRSLWNVCSFLINKPRIIIQTVSATTSAEYEQLSAWVSQGWLYHIHRVLLLADSRFVSFTSGHGSELALQF